MVAGQGDSSAGRWITRRTGDETYRAFIPHPLPPQPPLDLRPLESKLEAASIAVGRLDGLTTVLPDPSLFLYFYVRKEAVLSSQIEGTQSTLSDLLLFESDAVPRGGTDDVRLVSNYVRAMSTGLARLKEIPLSLRLIRELHEILLADSRGAEKSPGEFRRSQNWVGGSRPGNAVYVPPPPEELDACLDAFERYLHRPSDLPELIRIGLLHAQFETIHPFLDGNGRLGRLLITFVLCTSGILKEPSLYVSLYLKANRDRYYELLQAIRTDGRWHDWLEFFLEAVRFAADEAVFTARRLLSVFSEDRAAVEALGGRKANSALRVHQALQRRPLAGIAELTKQTRLTAPTVTAALDALQQKKIVRETTGQAWGRIFAYDRYLQVLLRGDDDHTQRESALTPEGTE